MVGGSPEDIASFLLQTEGLDKTTIGDYLGEREDTALKVMHAYIDALDFAALEFDAAIRQFLQVGAGGGGAGNVGKRGSCSKHMLSWKKDGRRAQGPLPPPRLPARRPLAHHPALPVATAPPGLPPAGRGAEDRPPHGEVCGALHRVQPREVRGPSPGRNQAGRQAVC